MESFPSCEAVVNCFNEANSKGRENEGRELYTKYVPPLYRKKSFQTYKQVLENEGVPWTNLYISNYIVQRWEVIKGEKKAIYDIEED